MKKSFYNPHTIIKDITQLDKKWLQKQNRDKPFDIHYIYLEALRLIGKNKPKELKSKLAKILQDFDGRVRVSSLLDRIAPNNPNNSNSISTVEIKSNKSEQMSSHSPLLTGLIPLISGLQTRSTDTHTEDHDPSNVSDDIAPPSSMTIDVIDLKELEDGEMAVDKEPNTIPDSSLTDQASQEQDEDDEEEEYVSVIVKQDDVSIPQSSAASITESSDALTDTSQVNNKITPQVPETAKEKVERMRVEYGYRSENNSAPTVSDSVQITHSKFTSWLSGLPRLDETNQVPDTDTSTSIISEPYAKLLVKQGHKQDAINMYKQLMLKYPEKSSFFADQIKKLK